MTAVQEIAFVKMEPAFRLGQNEMGGLRSVLGITEAAWDPSGFNPPGLHTVVKKGG
jgi:hypothetical protein